MKTLIIVGPTAVGKTAIAEIAAEQLGAEIVSADSRQVYRGLSVGTAKPVLPQQRYWLLDIAEPTERYDAARFVRDALAAMENIISRSLVPIVVGGTGLYIRALTVGLFPGEFRDPAVRADLKRRYEEGENLYEFLQKIDPEAAQKIDPANFVRIERALEVFIISGMPISHWWHTETKPPSGWNFTKVGLKMDREMLYGRIQKRTEEMLASGWIDEVRALLDAGLDRDAPAFSSIGYRSVLAHVKGELDFDEMVAQIVKDTKHYAKRQMTWFRKEPDVTWIDADEMPPESAAEKIVNIWTSGLSESA